jgi:hypothetical protein
MKKTTIIIIFALLVILGVGGTWYTQAHTKKTTVNKPAIQLIKSYAECKNAGYVVIGDSQKLCTTHDGIEFYEPKKVATTMEHFSEKSVKLIVTEPLTNTTVLSPLTIRGVVPGNWSFEAAFPIQVLDSSGKVIGRATAKLIGEWATDKYVPFEATVIFDAQASGSKGTILLKKDNPSDLPENNDSVTIPVNL